MRSWIGLLAGWVLLATGCDLGQGINCTQIGCGGGIPFRIVGPDGGPEAGVYELTITLDGEQTVMTCDTTEVPVACEREGAEMVHALVSPNDRVIEVEITYYPTRYELTVLPPDGNAVSEEGEFTYAESFPNGPDCGVCRTIEQEITIELER